MVADGKTIAILVVLEFTDTKREEPGCPMRSVYSWCLFLL